MLLLDSDGEGVTLPRSRAAGDCGLVFMRSARTSESGGISGVDLSESASPMTSMTEAALTIAGHIGGKERRSHDRPSSPQRQR